MFDTLDPSEITKLLIMTHDAVYLVRSKGDSIPLTTWLAWFGWRKALGVVFVRGNDWFWAEVRY